MEAIVVLKLSENENNLCRRCHRKLKDAESIKLGFGKICYQKQSQHQKTYLFAMEEPNETITQRNI